MTRAEVEQLVRAKARACGLDERIAHAQIGVESSFNPRALGPQTKSGRAKGLAQFIDDTARRFGVQDPYDPEQALDGYCKYMSHLLSRFGGRYDLALAGYHSGERAARAALNNCKGNPKTCNYVAMILARAGQSSLGTGGTRRTVATPPSDKNAVIGVIALVTLAAIALSN